MKTLKILKHIALLVGMLLMSFMSEGQNVTAFSENFEHSGSLPSGWTSSYSSPEWQCVTRGLGSTSTPSSAHSGNYCLGIYYEYDDCDWNRYYSPLINLSTYSSATLSFYLHKEDWLGDTDELKVYYRTSTSSDWTLLQTYSSSISSWTQQTISLPNLSSTYQIAFRANCCYGYGVYIDDVTIIGVTNIQTYTVTYDANGGTGTMTDTNSPYTSGGTVTILTNTFTRNGYEFIGWNTQPNGSSTSYDEGDTFTINSNIILYAQWSEIPQPNTIILNQNITQNIGCGTTYNFYDSGGEDGSYGNNETYIATFTSTSGIILTFSSFISEAGWDSITIYDGTTSGTLLLNKYSGTMSTPSIYTATSGTMTIVWKSDGSVQKDGWAATVTADCSICLRPSNLQVSNITTNSVHITWESENTNFQWSLDNSTWTNITGTSIDLSNLTSNTPYTFYIRTDCGNDDISNTASITFRTLKEPFNCSPHTTCQIGTGTSTTSRTPFNSLWEYSFVEQIYNANEINGSGLINSIAFEMNENSISQTNNIKVFIKHTTKDIFSTTTDYESVTSSDLYFSRTYTFFPGNNEIVPNTQFNYNGIDNLLIAIYEYTAGYSTRYFYYTSAPNKVISFHSDSYNPDLNNLNNYNGNKYTAEERANISICIDYDDPLPISLLSFTASPQSEYNLVQWTTATEKNNDLFILERSEDAVVFDEVYNVSGAGNSLESIDYEFRDYCPVPDITYYRLTQVDYDGTRTSSEMVSCIRTSEKMSNWDYFTRYDNLLQVHSNDKVLTIVCSDLLGRTIWQGRLLPHDDTELNLQAPYIIHIYEDDVLVGSEKVLW